MRRDLGAVRDKLGAIFLARVFMPFSLRFECSRNATWWSSSWGPKCKERTLDHLLSVGAILTLLFFFFYIVHKTPKTSPPMLSVTAEARATPLTHRRSSRRRCCITLALMKLSPLLATANGDQVSLSPFKLAFGRRPWCYKHINWFSFYTDVYGVNRST